jgi:hypothetical protein
MSALACGAVALPEYSDADPFPHVVLDGLFDPARLGEVSAAARSTILPAEPDFYGSFLKHKLSDRSAMAPAIGALIDELNARPFVSWLEELTGIPNLRPDPHLEGGGLHRIGRGGFLKIHTDFNWHARLQMHRRVNLIVYLNEDWSGDWGGHLELWARDMSALGARVAPVFNRTVIFSTTDDSYHGHPDPLRCPQGVTRNSVALYYYTVEAPPSRFGRSDMTNYRERPCESFGGGKHRLHQMLIKNPRLRRVIRGAA